MNELRLYRAYFSTTYETQNALKVPTGWRLQFLSVLPDAISCEVREELNGQYEAEIIYPATGFQHSTYEDTSIGLEKILGIKCPLRDSISENLFRIYRVDRDLGGYFHIYARQLSYDLNHFAATKDGISAVTGGITNFADSYGVHSYGMNLRAISNMDIPFAFGGDAEYDTSITGAGFQQDWSTCTSIRAYLGGEELTGYDLSALRRFGGEFEFSRFDVNLWEERGQDRDVTVTYGTSMMGLDSVDSSEGVYNAVCCFSTETDGAYYKKHTATANCQHMGGLTYRSVKIIDCSSDVMEKYPDGATDAQIDALLLSLANEEAKRIDSPSGLTRKITIDVAESELNGVYLGDTIRVLYIRNGLSLDDRLKITSYTWDVLRQRYTSITVGPIQSSLAGEIIDAGEKSDIIALQNVAASTQNAIQELQARYVLKAGDTMTGALTINKTGEKFVAKDERMDAGVAPSSALYNDIFYALDKNDELCGQLSIGQWTTGVMNMIIGVRALNGSSPVINQLQLGAKTDGTLSVSLTAPNAWLSALGLTATNFNLTAGTNVTINEQQSCKVGRMVFISARFTLSAQIAAYSTLATMPYSAARAWVAPLYNASRLPLTNTGIYADSGNATIRATVAIPAGTYRICVSIPVTS